jgi:hypothetical protein
LDLGLGTQAVGTLTPTFTALVAQHKIPLTPLLKRLQHHRLRWRFTNPSHLFDERTVQDIKRIPNTLEVAARFLEDGGATFVARSTSWKTERFDRILRGGPIDSDGSLSVDYSEINKSGVSMDGAVRGTASPRDSVQWEEVMTKQSRAAALLLRRTAAKMRLLPWPSVTDDRGVAVFKSGPRRRQVVEAAAARDLVAFFKDQTSRGNAAGRSLYEHVGWLLWATFPSLKGWRSAHASKRLQDHVKQLLRA